jgi:hypothetical protein
MPVMYPTHPAGQFGLERQMEVEIAAERIVCDLDVDAPGGGQGVAIERRLERTGLP